MTNHHKKVGAGLAVAAVIAISLNLRAAATGIGPLLEEITEGIGLGPAGSGVLTALPGFCFGAMGLIAVLIARRAGISTTLLGAMVIVIIGLAVRPWVGSWWVFLLFTMLALAGIAVGNVLVPAWIKRHGGPNTVRLMTGYSTLLVVGGTLGAFAAAPLASAGVALLGDSLGAGWQYSLAFWAIAALVPAAIWWVVSRRTGHDFPPTVVSDKPRKPVWTSRTAWALTILFGVQSMNAYVQFGWLPQIYRDAGMPAETAGLLLALLTSLGVLGGLIMPTVIERSSNISGWMILFGSGTLVGYLGLLWQPIAGAWLWAIILGIAGCAFPTAISLIPARSRDAEVTAQLSGFVQPVGYLLAASGPLIVGLIHMMTPDWTVVLCLLAASGIAIAVAGILVARPVMVDDEL